MLEELLEMKWIYFISRPSTLGGGLEEETTVSSIELLFWRRRTMNYVRYS